MNKLEIQKDKILKALIEDEGTKAILKRLIEDQLSEGDLYLIACAKLGIQPKPELKDISDPDEVWADNAIRLAVLIRAENMVDGKIRNPVYDGTETHYWPVPDLSDPSGFGFSGSACGFRGACSNVGSRFEYFSEADARAGFEKFNPYYKIHYTK